MLHRLQLLHRRTHIFVCPMLPCDCQRKFREADEEESYFNDDDDDTMDVIANNAAGTQEKMPATEEEAVASLMEDVKSLDD